MTATIISPSSLQNIVNAQTGNGNINTNGSVNQVPSRSTSAGTTSASTAGGVSSSAQQALSNNFNDYLKLLTTQLQNQDPTQPMDTNAMTQQIASLAQVEQQISTNQQLGSLLAAYNTSQINGVVGYIGRRVEATGNTTVLQNGSAMLVYNLAAPAASATITVQDSTGNVIYKGASTQLSQGRNVIDWNGLNSLTKGQSPDGAYTYTVDATDANGQAVAATTYTTGTVSAVDISSGTPTLQLGSGFTVPLSGITKIEPDPLSQTSSQAQNVAQ